MENFPNCIKYKLTNLRYSIIPKHKKHEENYTKHTVTTLLKNNAREFLCGAAG